MELKDIIFLVIGLLGVIVAIYFGIKALKEREPLWAYATYRYIGRGTDAPSELKVLFGGREVEQVCVTRIIFFNKGREVIRKVDITEKIGISFPNVTILRQPIIYKKSREQNEFSAQQVNNCVFLDFQYLGHKDGAAIEVLHTGDPDMKLTMNGNVIDAEIKNINPFSPLSRKQMILKCITDGIYYVLMSALFLFFLFRPEGDLETYLKSDRTFSDFGPVGMVIFLILVNIACYIYFTRPYMLNYFKYPTWIKET